MGAKNQYFCVIWLDILYNIVIQIRLIHIVRLINLKYRIQSSLIMPIAVFPLDRAVIMLTLFEFVDLL